MSRANLSERETITIIGYSLKERFLRGKCPVVSRRCIYPEFYDPGSFNEYLFRLNGAQL